MIKPIANAIAASLLAFTVSTHAQVPVLTDLPATAFANIIGTVDFTPANVLMGLEAIAKGSGLPTPTPYYSDYSTGPIAADDYLVIYYDGPVIPPDGNDPDLLSAPGTFDIYYFFKDAPAGFVIPPPGPGERFVFASLYDHVDVVPDGGSTLALLGLSLGFVAFARRRA